MGNSFFINMLDKIKGKDISYNLLQRRRHNANITIDIRSNSVIIAVSEKKKNGFALVKLEEKIFPEKIDKNNGKFQSWLNKIIKGVEKEFSRPFFWLLISSKYVETFYFTIPKVNKSKIENLIFLALKKESKGKVTKNIYDYSIIGEKKQGDVEQLEVFAYVVEKAQLEEMAEFAKKLNLEPLGISAYHLALSNLFKNNGAVGHLFLGTDWSRIDIYKGGYLVFNRNIKTGFVSFANEIIEKIESQPDIELALDDAKNGDIKTKNKQHTLTHEDVKNYFSHLAGGEVQKEFYKSELEDLEFKKTVSSTLQRLILQIRRTMDFYISSIQHSDIKKIYISGIVDLPDEILKEIQDILGIEVKRLWPLTEGLVETSGNISVPKIKEADYAPVLGCCIQDKDQFNFLFTRLDRQKQRIKKIISTSISTFFVFLTICLAGYYFYLSAQLKKEKDVYKVYQHKIAHIKPLIDENKLRQLAEKLNEAKKKAKTVARAYKPISIIKELSRFTPDDIKWTRLDMDVKKETLKIDVAIKANNMAKLKIANYILSLKKSPLVKDITISKEKDAFYSGHRYNSFSLEVSFK